MARPTERKSRPGIERDEFAQRLAKAGLTKARFAELTGLRREAVINWNHRAAPAWTVPFLLMYANIPKTVRDKIDKWADFMPP